MFANERQNKIYDILHKEGAVTTGKLVKLFCVSLETIRRDLLAMEKDGRLVRVHGGAVAKSDMKPFRILKERNKEYWEQKYALSQKACEFISEEDIIGIDSGSTAAVFAEVLRERFNTLTVVTHSLDVFRILSEHKNFSVILCGGYYLREENSFYGDMTLDMLDSLHVSKAFIFPSAISLKHGICDFQKDLFPIQKKLVSSADKVYVLADSSKFEKTGLLRLGSMKPDYVYITDNALKTEISSLYRENDIKVY